MRRLHELNSDNYSYIGTRHRPPMFSDYIQKLIRKQKQGRNGAQTEDPAVTFSYPSII